MPQRKPAIDFARVERHWCGGDVFMSNLLSALSITFPEGERFFMDSVRQSSDALTDDVLRREVSQFLAQEVMHGRLHEAFNDWVRSQGIETADVERQARERLQRIRVGLSPEIQLAVTCALEHFTAILAEYVFSHDDFREGMREPARSLWVWHAVEETEHKSVAFDVYQASGGRYLIRAGTMLFTTFKYMRSVFGYQRAFMRQDPTRPGLWTYLRGFWTLFGSPGIFRSVIPAWLDYFRPGFHPWQRTPPKAFERLREEF